MDSKLILATDRGVEIATRTNGDWALEHRSLNGHGATSVVAREGTIIAGTREGLFRSADLGESWQPVNDGVTKPHIRWLAYHPQVSDLEFAGTEPAGIFRSTDGGDSWKEASEVNALRDELGWWLPYSPEAGCVRGFAFLEDRGYAAVEVGGVLRSDDQGVSWRLAEGSDGKPRFQSPRSGQIHADVHSIGVHPTSKDLVFAATNAGLYRSRDGGGTWGRINRDGYTRAFWVDDRDPDHILTAPARSVGRHGTILKSVDGGNSWSDFSAGAGTPWPDTMVERFLALGNGSLIAILDDGRTLISESQAPSWRQIFSDAGRVNAASELEQRLSAQ